MMFISYDRVKIEEKKRKSNLDAENHRSEQNNLKQTTKNYERLQNKGNETSEKNRSPKEQSQVIY
jgi:hypothetical protein